MLNITASIYASENGFDNCLLLNDSKNVVEAIKGIFYANNKLITPPVSEGCLNGVNEKQILEIAKR
jgi:branched-chain amino acid aminotransferase